MPYAYDIFTRVVVRSRYDGGKAQTRGTRLQLVRKLLLTTSYGVVLTVMVLTIAKG